jgi:hypothetical protein
VERENKADVKQEHRQDRATRARWLYQHGGQRSLWVRWSDSGFLENGWLFRRQRAKIYL